MQTSPAALRISNISHGTNPILPLSENQIVVYDSRLRNWSLSFSGGLSNAYTTNSKLNALGEIVRIRTLSDNTLDVRYGTPSISLIFSSNVVTLDALAGSGVDLIVDGANVDIFWIDADGITVNTARSTNNGHSFGGAVTIYTLPAQGTGVLPQLCAPQLDTVVFSDSTIGFDDNDNPLTGLYICLRISGTWNTPTLSDLGGQPLGIEVPVPLPNGSSYPSNLSGMGVSATSIELVYYGNQLLQLDNEGLWIQRIANLDYANVIQHLHFGHPEDLFTTIGIDDDNSSTQIFGAFPRIQRIGDEYWITAIESSKFAGHERYHLAFFRSTDAIAYSDRYYNQGAANDDQYAAYVYNGATPFLLTDLLYASLIVTDEFTYIVSYDRVFYCPSTILVGVDNPNMRIDLTPVCDTWSVNLPAAPTSASANYTLQNVPKNWNSSDILAAHRGIIIKQRAGYKTQMGDELIDVGIFNVDQINQHTELGVNDGSVSALDNTMLLDRTKMDLYWEYEGSKIASYGQFCDMTPFIIQQGSFTTGLGGRLKSGIVNVNDNFRDDIAAINIEQTNSSFLTFRFRCDRTWDNNHAGCVFQGRSQGDEDDNKVFWAILYGRTAGRFTLNRAIPRANPNRVKLYKYTAFKQQSDEIDLDNGTWYWMRIGVWHGHVMAWYTTDTHNVSDANWNLVIDYLSPASPADDVICSRVGWNALVGTQRVQASGALGQIGSSNGQEDLSDGAGNPRVIALHVQLGDQPSYLRRVNVSITQENTTQLPMPDASIFLAAGDDANPADLTDEDNIYFANDASALYFSAHDKPRWIGANPRPNPSRPQFDPYTHLWICVTYNAPTVAGQSYKWSSDDTGTYGANTRYSDDGGITWNSFPDANLNLTASVEVEYIYGRVKFNQMYYASGENVKTYESLAHQIAAKAGVLNIVPDDFLSESMLVLGADNIDWQPEVIGTIGDLVLDTDVDITGTFRFYFGSETTGVGDATSNIVEIIHADQTIGFYNAGENLLAVSESLQYLPETFHLQIVNHSEFVYVYVNECLASVWQNIDFANSGFVGVDSVGATFTNLRIPDMHQVVDYFAIQAGESSLSALQRLVAKPANGTIARDNFFIRYDGALRIGSFAYREITDTYQNTIFTTDKSESAQIIISQLEPQGNYYALHTNPTMLDSDGRIYDTREYSDAVSDDDAYRAADQEFRSALEKQVSPSFQVINNYATEREDADYGINPNDKTSGVFIVNNITLNGAKDSALMTIAFRKFIE